MSKKNYNPEHRVWRGRSYKKGGTRINDLSDKDLFQEEEIGEEEEFLEKEAQEIIPTCGCLL